MTIGEELKFLRLKAGMTQEEMAAGVVSESFYSKVERGVHAINAKDLLDILVIHHFDVGKFFTQLAYESGVNHKVNYQIIDQINYAQEHKDVKKLDRISDKLANYEENSSWVKLKLDLAYEWINTSSKKVSTDDTLKKIKQFITTNDWNRDSYNILASSLNLLIKREADYYVHFAFQSFKKHPTTDSYTLQSVAMIAVNYLECCCRSGKGGEELIEVEKFLRNLPNDTAIGLYKIVGLYYKAIIDKDYAAIPGYKDILNKAGYGEMLLI